MSASTVLSWKVAPYKDLQRPDYRPALTLVGAGHPLAGNVSPLKSKVAPQSSEEKSQDEGPLLAGPLSASSTGHSEVMWDPLSAFADQELEDSFAKQRVCLEEDTPMGDIWPSKKAGILSRFGSGVERLSLASSYLSGEMPSPISSSSRHEQLDSFEEGSIKELRNLSVQEYTQRLLELKSAMVAAWNRDEKVNALKMVIQCSKLLVDADSSVRFYPAKFVLITDIVDLFGELVFERLHAKHRESQDGAAETARNWFYKIASIRELIPRFYVEACILESYRFLDPKGAQMQKTLLRLAKTITGIGDPLVAAYARCYLTRIGSRVAPNSREHLSELMFGLLVTYGQLESSIVEERLKSDLVDLPSYYALFMPALEFLLQWVTQTASDKQLGDLLNKCTQRNSALLLNALLTAMRPQFVAQRAELIVEKVNEADTVTAPRGQLYRSLGLCLMVEDPPEGVRVKVLNQVWKHVARFKNSADYMSCAEVWVDYVCRHMDFADINTFIAVTIKQMNVDRAYERHQSQLYAIIDRIASNVQDLVSLFNMDRLLPLLDLIQKEPYKTDACRSLLDTFTRRQKDSTCEAVLVSSLMHVSKTMLSSVTALTLDDSRRSLASLVCGFINRIEYPDDVEAQLSFFIDARACLGTLDDVLIHLVHAVNRLAVRLQTASRGRHSRKSVAQAKACLAYGIVTIPSVYNSTMRFKLYLETAIVALKYQCHAHADACYKAALDSISTISERDLYSCVASLLGQLVYSPDDPREDPLSLVTTLLEAIDQYPFDAHIDVKPRLWLATLRVISRMATPWAEDVQIDCNDSLYGGDQRYVEAVEVQASSILAKIIDYVALLRDSKLFERQAALLVELLYTLASHGAASVPGPSQALIVKLWSLTRATNVVPLDTLASLRSYIARRANNTDVLSRLT
ncbi:UPF0505 protein C16orf62-like [Tropilaelaps mercedesae]|uniref:UPF0505 protein C16orf62-like n=1 Tax=Tropilaelaps mercedesae TaxID=418985 RepID=A0A1V9X9C6_9ACAR|nr:UPF0505 protein C16orf62-like [Tropilaelaps mercedesae]